MKITKIAAVDIGSNAIRLLIDYIYDNGKEVVVNKESLIRLPIRLGQDSFTKGEISEENTEKMVHAFNAFKLLLKVHGIDKMTAFATSAMREARNSKKVIDEVEEKTGVKIEIISGRQEANIIFGTELKSFIQPDKNYIYVDVGGGSTEITLLSKGKVVDYQSFNMGTVRFLQGKVGFDYLEKDIKKWLVERTKDMEWSLIGSGGNINHIFKRSGRPEGKPLSYTYLNHTLKEMKSMTYDERMMHYNMKPDRADVIIPALTIYTKIMNWTNTSKIYVPKIGLADGIIQYMYTQDKLKNDSTPKQVLEDKTKNS